MSSSDDEYDIAVVGGGPAGLTTALYGARLGHETVLIDRGGGRAAMMADTHNVIGVTEETSGNEFLATGREQVQSYGGTFERGFRHRRRPHRRRPIPALDDRRRDSLRSRRARHRLLRQAAGSAAPADGQGAPLLSPL